MLSVRPIDMSNDFKVHALTDIDDVAQLTVAVAVVVIVYIVVFVIDHKP